jgi:hypothetical protein
MLGDPKGNWNVFLFNLYVNKLNTEKQRIKVSVEKKLSNNQAYVDTL